MASLRHQASVASAVCKHATSPRWAQSVASAPTYSSRSLSSPTFSASCTLYIPACPLLDTNEALRQMESPPAADQLLDRIAVLSYCPATNLPRLTYPVFTSAPRLQSSSQMAQPSRHIRTFLTHLRRQAQALKEQPVPSAAPTLPGQGKQPLPPLQLSNLPYFVRRTGSNQLPVYLVTKAGGTKQLTKIQKTEGDMDALRSDLAQTLGLDVRSPDVSINRLNGHIIIKVCLFPVSLSK